MNKIPLRTCVITREKLPKKELIRVVKTPTNEICIDDSLSMKKNGRGAYLKKDIDVINKAKKTKALERHLEIKIEDNIYDELIEYINKI